MGIVETQEQMMATTRFKIDLYDLSSRPYGLYVRNGGWMIPRWKLITSFDSIAEARAYYDKIKDLPEYLT